jgi:hypothetical protein
VRPSQDLCPATGSWEVAPEYRVSRLRCEVPRWPRSSTMLHGNRFPLHPALSRQDSAAADAASAAALEAAGHAADLAVVAGGDDSAAIVRRLSYTPCRSAQIPWIAYVFATNSSRTLRVVAFGFAPAGTTDDNKRRSHTCVSG